jgi:hypothetical protein
MLKALALLLLVIAPPAVIAASCNARSGPKTVALVELYTSEGCNSCPPADRWLSGLGAQGYGPDRVVPLALHVDYWDYIGWKDPYAKREFSQRQRKLTLLQRQALVYTPQVMLQGKDFRGWGARAFDQEWRASTRSARAPTWRLKSALSTRGAWRSRRKPSWRRTRQARRLFMWPLTRTGCKPR